MSASITGGSGNDTIFGSSGDDTIAAGAGDDAVHGSAGNDLIDGGEGQDVIWGDGGDDTILGGGGNDQLAGEDGADLVFGGGGDDTIWATGGDDTLYGDAGSDRFYIGDSDGRDVIIGGEDGGEVDALDFFWAGEAVAVTFSSDEAGSYGNVTAGSEGTFSGIEQVVGSWGGDWVDAHQTSGGTEIYGMEGADTLLGGTGDDHLVGGGGDDVIWSNAGADTMEGGAGADLFYLADGDGADLITDFNMAMTDGHTTDQLDVSYLTNGSGDPVRVWDVTVEGDATGARILFPGGGSLQLAGVSAAQLAEPGQLHAMGIPCFTRGTRIETPQGALAVEDLRPGMEVLCADGRPQPILWCGCRDVTHEVLKTRPALRPVVIAPGRWGNARELRLSRQHRVAVWTAQGPALAAVGHLADLGVAGLRMARGCREVSYHHLLLPRHAVIRAEGALVESLWPGGMAMAALGAVARAEIHAILPPLAECPGDQAAVARCYGPPALPFLTRRQLRALPRPLRAVEGGCTAGAQMLGSPENGGQDVSTGFSQSDRRADPLFLSGVERLRPRALGSRGASGAAL